VRDMLVTKKRLRSWIGLLTADHLARGKVWYHNAHVFAQTVASRYGLPVQKVIGILAVLSVQNRWDLNKRDAESLIRAAYEGRDPADVSVGTYAIQKRKAIDILRAPADAIIGEMIGTKYAPKTIAFFANILDPSGTADVTVDRWILRGLGLENVGGGGNGYIALYRRVESLFKDEAKRLGLRPCQLQAAVWVCIQETADAEQWEGSRPYSGLAETVGESFVDDGVAPF
jgi:hypothetical protein